jgi:CDP-glucose 4,6-dehydratase
MKVHISPWYGRRVLVIGCTEFLGTAVTRELLNRGATVIGLLRRPITRCCLGSPYDLSQFRVVHGRAEDAARLHSAMAVHEVSAVFHLASIEPDAVLRAAALYHPQLPVVAVQPAEPLRLAITNKGHWPVPVGIARFGELFGSGDRQHLGIIPRTVIGLLNGNRDATASDGPTRDFVFVRDAATACLALAEAVAKGGQSLDCTFRSGWELTEAEIVSLIADLFAGRPVEPVRQDVSNPLSWQPATPFSTALSETIAWFRTLARVPTAPTQRRAA